MKRKKIIILFIVLFLGIVIVVHLQKNYDIDVGIYEMKNGESYVELKEDGTFHFILYILAGHSLYGNYSVEKDMLKLYSQSGEYIFYIRNKKIIFKEGDDDLTGWGIKKGSKYFYTT